MPLCLFTVFTCVLDHSAWSRAHPFNERKGAPYCRAIKKLHKESTCLQKTTVWGQSREGQRSQAESQICDRRKRLKPERCR